MITSYSNIYYNLYFYSARVRRWFPSSWSWRRENTISRSEIHDMRDTYHV